MTRIVIAHSPDSDDAYMMAPLALGWLDDDPDRAQFECEFVRKDIETLNAEATESRYDVTAISFGAYPELRGRYDLLTAGSSIQEGTGPLVVSKGAHTTCGPGFNDGGHPRPSHQCLSVPASVDPNPGLRAPSGTAAL
ncbi:MAG: hypothetical protein IPN59_07310 [Holophaga sp.]|nr:hypothetical protein [Holophaga sp.]